MSGKIVAAFDFDKTITRCDSFIYFLLYCKGFFRTVLYLFLTLPKMTQWFLGPAGRQRAKEAVITRFFKECPLVSLQALADGFAKEELSRHVRPEAIERIKWHQKQGHTLVLISASIDLYLKPWCKEMGFDHLLASQLEITDDGLVSGVLKGKNCWGKEKKKRLEELLGSKELYTLYAYGDSEGDKELLEMADYPHFRRMS